MRDKRTTKRAKATTQKRSSRERPYGSGSSPRKDRVREGGLKGKTDWYRLRAMTDEEAERNASTDSDNRPADPGWLDAGHLVPATQKELISVRLDSDVLAWFRAAGARYQTRMNEVLKAYVQHQKTTEIRSHTRNRTKPTRGIDR
ncbi:MAG: BrnA antitoxin family protein [Gemmatimonadaceae bacterium]